MAKKRTRKTKKDAVNLGADGGPVGPGNPPKEHQFKPGESGNPKGQPRHRTHLWTHICKFSNMTDAELAKLDREKLTQAQQTALKIVEQGTSGDKPEWERMARYVVDRSQFGKALSDYQLTQYTLGRMATRIAGARAITTGSGDAGDAGGSA